MFHHIREAVCTDCGSLPRHDYYSQQQHSSGGWFEERTFHCGKAVKSVPNCTPTIVSVSSECPNTPSELEKTNKKRELRSQIIEICNNVQGLSSDEKRKILTQLVYGSEDL